MSADSEKLQAVVDDLTERCELCESWLRAINEFANFDIWFKDQDSRYQYVNSSFEQSMGRSRETLLDKLPQEVFGQERANRVVALDQKVMKDGQFERVIPCDESGRLLMHHEQRFPVNNNLGQVIGLGCFAFEVTDRSVTEEALTQAQSMAKLGNWRWSIRESCLISCSEEFAKLLGYSVKEVFQIMPDRVNRLVHPDDRAVVEAVTNNRTPQECTAYRIAYRIILPNGDIRHVYEIAQPLIGNDGVPVEYVGTLQDVTDYKRIEKELLDAKAFLEQRVQQRTEHLRYMASHDDLTGLFNRTEFYQLVAERTGRNRGKKNFGVAIIMIDLDGFKDINDYFGYSVGDEVLRIVSKRLHDSIRNTDIVARLGGDEFAIAAFDLPNPENDARAISEYIMSALSERITMDSVQLNIACCMGISLLRDGEVEFEDAVKWADIALCKAKKSNSRIVLFEKQMERELTFRKTLENDLRTALRDGDIKIVFQPQVRTKDEVLVGFEALARWKHPAYGNVSPAIFVSIAENCGLINEFGDYVLDRSCREFLELQAYYGSDIRLAVNLSVAQFYNPGMFASLKATLERYQLPGSNLEIEITESLFIKNIVHTRETLKAMRAIGLRIALDDFGTGCSALSYLKDFEIDVIKIDRGFIKDVLRSKFSQRIVCGIINLSKSLGINVIGEGVELAEQVRFLRAADCKIIQGFYYGYPLSKEELLEHEMNLTTRYYSVGDCLKLASVAS